MTVPANRPMFPHTFDSTMLAAFASCPQKMFRTYVEHWKPKSESVHLVAGGAFAKGIEVARKAFYEGVVPVTYWRTKDPITGIVGTSFQPVEGWEEVHELTDCEPGMKAHAEAAGLEALIKAYGDFECPADSAKSLERTAGALEFYYASYPFGECGLTPIKFPDGRWAIEFSFAEPLDVVHPVTGDPILYTGRLDCIGEFAGGIYGVDEKTASSLGASWSKQWEMRSQFTGYQWAANRAGVNMQGSLVRGVSILKTKYDTQQAITYRSPYEVERWYKQTLRNIARAIEMWKEGYWDFDLNGACAEYGGCNMVSICKSAEPEQWLPMYFDKRVWDPLARKELTVAEWEASWGHTANTPTITAP